MENLGHKKNTCEEKNIFPPKWLRKMHLKNVGFTYNIKVKFQSSRYNKKFLTKKMRNDTFKCSKFSLYQQQITFRVFRIQKTCNFLNFLKESNNSRFLAILLKKWFFVNIKKIEKIPHLFVKHFLLYLEL